MSKITILIPTYNRSFLLKRSISSVLNQTYTDFTLHIFDNHSIDDTAKVVEEFSKQDSRVHYHRHPKNIGIINNFLAARNSVKSPFLAFLGDDDFWLPSFLESAMDGFFQHPDIALSMTNWISCDEPGPHSKTSLPSGYYRPGEGVEHLAAFFPFLFACIFKTEIIKTMDAFDKSSGMIFDIELILKLTLDYPFVFSEKTFACHQAMRSNITDYIVNNHIDKHFSNLIYLEKSFKSHKNGSLYAKIIRRRFLFDFWEILKSNTNKNQHRKIHEQLKNVDISFLNKHVRYVYFLWTKAPSLFKKTFYKPAKSGLKRKIQDMFCFPNPLADMYKPKPLEENEIEEILPYFFAIPVSDFFKNAQLAQETKLEVLQ